MTKGKGSFRVCCGCGKPVDMSGLYTVVWDLPNIYFAHVECGERLEDKIAALVRPEDKGRLEDRVRP